MRNTFLRNNIFYGNRPDELLLETGGDFRYNIIEGGMGDLIGVYDRDPLFLENGALLEVQSAEFDAQRFRTRLQVRGTPPDSGRLAGRVVRVADTSAGWEPDFSTGGEPPMEEAIGGLRREHSQYPAFRASWWSLIADHAGEWIEVWGELPPDPELRLEVVRTFHLSAGSPAINNGLYTDFAADDIDGQPRYTPTIDFGADEFHPADHP